MKSYGTNEKDCLVEWRYVGQDGQEKVEFSKPLTHRQAIKTAEKLQRQGQRAFVRNVNILSSLKRASTSSPGNT